MEEAVVDLKLPYSERNLGQYAQLEEGVVNKTKKGK
jgi:hypothetical protein